MIVEEHSYILPSYLGRAVICRYSGFSTSHSVHQHATFQFVYVLEGEFVFEIGEERERLQAGELCVLSPELSHQWYHPSGMHSRLYIFFCGVADHEQLGGLADFLAPWVRGQFRRVTLPLGEIEPLVSQLTASSARPETVRQAVQLALNLLIITAFCERIEATVPFQPRSDVPEGVMKAVAFIEKNYADALHLEQLAGLAALSPGRFSVLFNQIMGLPPMQYVNFYRLSKAQDLLLYSSLTLEAIAEKTGFRSLHYFCRAFRQALGEPPGIFRKKYWEKYREDKESRVTGDESMLHSGCGNTLYDQQQKLWKRQDDHADFL